jgi:hypothetical protein
MKMNPRFRLIELKMVALGLTCGCGGSDAGELFNTGPAVSDGAPAGSGGVDAKPSPSAPPTAEPDPSPPANPVVQPGDGVSGTGGGTAAGGTGGGGTGGTAQEPPPLPPPPDESETPSGPPSAEPPGAPDEETEPEPPPCVLGEFGTPEKLSGLALDEPLWGPVLSLVDTALFFAAGSGPEQLFFATRSDVTSAQFSAARPVVELASDAFDGTPFASASGLRLYFYSTRAGSNAGSRDLWFAERPALTAPFGPATPLTEVNSSSIDLHPRLSADGLSIVFTSQRPGGKGRTDIWRAQRSAVGAAFGAPENVAELNTDLDDTGPWVSSDGLTVFFASNRAGGQGALDFWRATRTSSDAPFGPAEPVAELNTPGDELDISLSSTEREALFSSNRDGINELWRAVRECQ